MANWAERVIGAAMLRSATYEEVEADRGANLQALAVVLVSAIAAGFSMAEGGGRAIGIGIIGALVGWVLWSGLTMLIGTKILPTPETKADMGELLRTTGFAAAPGLIRILGAVPLVGFVFDFIAVIWTWAAFVIAVRQALDYRSTARAVAVCALGWALAIAFAAVLGLFFGPTLS